MLPRKIVVVDCSASCVTLGVFSRGRGRLVREKYFRKILPPTDGRGAHWLEQVRPALSALRRESKNAGPTVLVLPARMVLTKFFPAPSANPVQREQVVRFEAEHQIPHALAEVVWGWVGAGAAGDAAPVMLAAAKVDEVGSLCAAAEAAGFAVSSVVPPVLATLAGFRLVHPDATHPSLVVRFDGCSTIFLQTAPDGFASRTVLATGAAGEGKDPCAAGADAETTEGFAASLAREIGWTELFLRRRHGMATPERIYLTGGGEGDDKLRRRLAETLEVAVEPLDPGSAIDSAVGANLPADDLPLEVPAILAGAAAMHLLPGQVRLDLLPPLVRRRVLARRRRPWWWAATLLALLAGILPWRSYRTLAEALERKSAAIERELAPWRSRDARLTNDSRQLAEMKREIVRRQDLYARRTAWLEFLADLEERIARFDGVWLEQLKVVPRPGATPRLEISGRMKGTAGGPAGADQANFDRFKRLVAGLVESPFVTAVEEERFEKDPSGSEKFGFVLVTNPRRPL